MPRIVPSAVIVVLLLVGGCAVNPATGERDFVLLSESQEIELGTRYHEQIRSHYGIYSSEQLQALVSEVGQRLARVSHRPGLDYRFTLLDSPEVNAFALPGGYVYITRGLLAYLNSEAELAAVLGHEIGHVTARHSVRQHSASTVTGLFGAILGAQVGAGGQELVNLAGTALVRGYGREHELESDRLGAQYLARAGYDPDAMLRVIRVLKHQEQHEIQQARAEGREPRVYHGLYATHPDNDRRLQEVISAARGLASAPRRHGEDVEFLRALDGMVFGESEAQGIVRGDHFYHGPLGVTLVLPAGWRTINAPECLAMVAPKGDAFIVLDSVPSKTNQSLREAIAAQFGDVPLRNAFTIDSAGREGYGGTLRLDTPYGVRDSRVLLMRIGGHTFRLIAAADPAPWPPAYARAIGRTMRGLFPLSEAQRPLARARRLRVIRARPGATIAKLSQNAAKLPAIEAQLRLLNHLYPRGEPQPGRWIKVIE